jgi:hypothetical protein
VRPAEALVNAAQLALPLCQRWHRGRTSYRPAREPIDPDRHGVDLIATAAAKTFVLEHHYSRSFPSSILPVGLFRTEQSRSRLAGVAVFGTPTHQGVIPHWTGVPAQNGCLLSRFVLDQVVEGNGETWTLRRAWAALRREKPHIEVVLAYSDPVARRAPSGQVLKPGHYGHIYFSHNGYYLGRGRARWLYVAPGGVVLNDRSLSKLRNDERGRDGVEADLIRLGAPPRRPHEAGAAYVARALREGPFRRVWHPGCHVYAWALSESRQLRERLAARALPHPTRPDSLVI